MAPAAKPDGPGTHMVEGEYPCKLPLTTICMCATHIPPTYPETTHRMGENLIQTYFRQRLKIQN